MNEHDIWEGLLDLDEAYREKDFLNEFRRPPLALRRVFYFIISLFSRIFLNVRVVGAANIPEKGPYIIAANHCSAADYPLIAWAMPKRSREQLYAVTTSYFYDNPFTRLFIMIATNSLRIDTKDDYIPALQASAKVLAQGGSIYINPEGTWSEDGTLMPFKAGVGLLSYKLKAPIIPVYIGGTYEMLPPHAILPKKRGKIFISFGKPIIPDRYSGQEAGYYVYNKIANDLREEIIKLRDQKTGI